MKKLFFQTAMLLLATTTLAQWSRTFDPAPTGFTVGYSTPNNMVEVTGSSPNQIWTIANTSSGPCNDGFWLKRTDVNGNSPTSGSYRIYKTGWHTEAHAIEQVNGDLFVTGRMYECASTPFMSHGFIMALDNSANILSVELFIGSGGCQLNDLVVLNPGSSNPELMAVGISGNSATGYDPAVVIFDLGLNVLSSHIYSIPNVPFPLPQQVIMSNSNTATIIGTTYPLGAPSEPFTMELDVSGNIVNQFVTYSNTAGIPIESPNICNFDAVRYTISGTATTSVTNRDVVAFDLLQSNRNMAGVTFSNIYDYSIDDFGHQTFNHGGNIMVGFGSEKAYTLGYQGLLELDGFGNISNTFEHTGAVANLNAFATIQSSANPNVYFQAATTNATDQMSLAQVGIGLGNACASAPTFTQTPITINTTGTNYTRQNWGDFRPITFSRSAFPGNDFDCNGIPNGTFKRDLVSVNELETLDANVYPTMSNGLVSIEMDADEATQATVLNCHGQVVHTERISSASHQMDISHLEAGQYILRLSSNQGEFRSMVTKL